MTNWYDNIVNSITNAIETVYAKKTDLSNKVDKETGKGLSTNDFTDSYKELLDNDFAYVDSNLNLCFVNLEDITLTSSDNEVEVGDTITLTATLTDNNSNPIVDAPIKFYKDNTLIGTSYSNSNGMATYVETNVDSTYTFKASIGNKNSNNINVTVATLKDIIITVYYSRNSARVGSNARITLVECNKTGSANGRSEVSFTDIENGTYTLTGYDISRVYNEYTSISPPTITVDESHTSFDIYVDNPNW